MKKYQIVKRDELTAEITRISVYAPLIAKKAKAGQFIILRVDEEGERIPLTISSTDAEKGLVTVIFQKVGGTTLALDKMNQGDCLHDFVQLFLRHVRQDMLGFSGCFRRSPGLLPGQ